tara:strand:- start:311 stop:535 length:225 start_codon:yes stop_codon:yes gene_type:complete
MEGNVERKKMKTISKKKNYVVETHCENGNVFLFGPFKARANAEKFARKKYALAKYGSTTTHDVRGIFMPVWERM